jgi:hypothetical protein
LHILATDIIDEIPIVMKKFDKIVWDKLKK